MGSILRFVFENLKQKGFNARDVYLIGMDRMVGDLD
jgi:hypothetical protein